MCFCFYYTELQPIEIYDNVETRRGHDDEEDQTEEEERDGKKNLMFSRLLLGNANLDGTVNLLI